MRIKMLSAALAVCATLLMVHGQAGAANSVLAVEPSATFLRAGDSFSVAIRISGAVDLFAYEFDLKYDPSVITATSVTESSFLGGAGSTVFIPGVIDNAAGLVSLTSGALSGPIAGIDGNGELVRYGFTAAANGSSALTLRNVSLLDSTLSPSVPRVSGATVQVASIPEPSLSWLMLSGLGILAWRGPGLRAFANKPA